MQRILEKKRMPNNQYRLFGFRLSFHEIAVLLICGLDGLDGDGLNTSVPCFSQIRF